MRPGAGVEFAQLALDTFGHWCRAVHLAGGALFVDVSAAFDTVLHQLLLDTELATPAVAEMLQQLGVHAKYVELIVDRITTGKPILAAASVPDDLVAITADFITGAWYSVEGVDRVLPLIRGSRPGNSVADVLFGYTSTALLAELHTALVDEWAHHSAPRLQSAPMVSRALVHSTRIGRRDLCRRHASPDFKADFR
jgi:hypothetical protein